MIKGVIIKPVQKFEDERGWLAEFFRDDEFDYRPSMCYVSKTKPGVARGPHEHKFQTDFFVFIGPGTYAIHLWDRREDSETKDEYMTFEVGENNPCAVVVPPGVVHGYKCVSDTAAMSINLPDKLYRGPGKQGEIDEIRWENKADSPYKIL